MKMLGSVEFAVMIPYWGGIDHQHLACVRALEKTGVPILTSQNIPYIDMARSFLVEQTREAVPGAKVLVFIDHDILFVPSDVRLLAEHCYGGPYAVLGASYGKRRPRDGLVGLPTDLETPLTFYQPGLVEARFVGMGFTAIDIAVFEKLDVSMKRYLCPTVPAQDGIRPYFRHMLEEGTNYYHGEDISFCRRAQAAGFKVGIDLEPRLLHRGTYDYALEDAGNCVPQNETLTVSFSIGEKGPCISSPSEHSEPKSLSAMAPQSPEPLPPV